MTFSESVLKHCFPLPSFLLEYINPVTHLVTRPVYYVLSSLLRKARIMFSAVVPPRKQMRWAAMATHDEDGPPRDRVMPSVLGTLFHAEAKTEANLAVYVLASPLTTAV